jgi:hypothetical protein
MIDLPICFAFFQHFHMVFSTIIFKFGQAMSFASTGVIPDRMTQEHLTKMEFKHNCN